VFKCDDENCSLVAILVIYNSGTEIYLGDQWQSPRGGGGALSFETPALDQGEIF
jgi:hypothetical protein